MKLTEINGKTLVTAFIAGANELGKKKDLIDSLNVFPVPDGDTGTNMYLTAYAAAAEVEKLPDGANAHMAAKAAAAGALRGARGNSGVILSQLYRGFAKGLEGCETADPERLAQGFSYAVEAAYKAIMKPKEGTILTVAKEMADKARETAFDFDDVSGFMSGVVTHGAGVLKNTTEMLPALKAAKVVDAGGMGLLTIIEGAVRAVDSGFGVTLGSGGQPAAENDFSAPKTAPNDDIKFIYCTEFFINTKNGSYVSDKTRTEILAFLDSIGDSVVVAADDGLIKVHVHTNNPGSVLEKAIKYGELDSVKIENMRIQHTEKFGFDTVTPPGVNDKPEGIDEEPEHGKEPKETGFIAVSSGEGFNAVFLDIGADVLIEGGQTMNPSAEQFLTAIDEVNAKNVIILPNNKNIILAAKQAADLRKDKTVCVIPTKSRPQGIAAMINYLPALDVFENALKMEESAKTVRTGQITFAVREAEINGFSIKEGDCMGIIDGDIAFVAAGYEETARGLLNLMIDDGSCFVTVYYGEGVSADDAEAIGDYITERHQDCEFDIVNGGQPVYGYIIAVE